MLVCDHANEFKKCDGCQHSKVGHEEVTMQIDPGYLMSCKDRGQCGVMYEGDLVLVDVQCVEKE